MRICMITSTPFPPEEGIGYHVYNLSKKLMNRGHKITVITRGSLKTVQKNTYEDISIIRVPFFPFYPFHVKIHGFFINKLFRSIENEFDVVHIHTPLSPIINTSLPIVNTIHSTIIEDMKHIEMVDLKSVGIKVHTRFFSYPLIKELIIKSKLTTTVSYSVVNELKEHYSLNDTFIVGNGVDEKKLCPSKEKKGDYILYVGRLGHRKGLFDLLEAAKFIVKDHNVKFVIIGKGELEKLLQERVKINNLENNVVFKGYLNREELIKHYQNASIFVMPSLYESGPLTLLEAMSCGTAVVTTSVGLAPELIKNFENGIIIPPHSPKEMAISVNRLLEDKDLREKLGVNARITVENKYTWDLVADRVEECYQKVLN